MNYREYYKIYCPAYNIVNKPPTIFCNPHCPHFIGLSKRKDGLVPLCEYEEIKWQAKNIG